MQKDAKLPNFNWNCLRIIIKSLMKHCPLEGHLQQIRNNKKNYFGSKYKNANMKLVDYIDWLKKLTKDD